jgi:hypothetical protein
MNSKLDSSVGPRKPQTLEVSDGRVSLVASAVGDWNTFAVEFELIYQGYADKANLQLNLDRYATGKEDPTRFLERIDPEFLKLIKAVLVTPGKTETANDAYFRRALGVIFAGAKAINDTGSEPGICEFPNFETTLRRVILNAHLPTRENAAVSYEASLPRLRANGVSCEECLQICKEVGRDDCWCLKWCCAQ